MFKLSQILLQPIMQVAPVKQLHRKEPLNWQDVGHFRAKCYFIGNGIQAYNSLYHLQQNVTLLEMAFIL